MVQIGVWEREEGVAGAVEAALAAAGRAGLRLLTGAHPAALAGEALSLLTVSPGAVGWAGAGAIRCRTALLPGTALPLARALSAESAVSYGASPKDTLTISSLEDRQICVALQREIITLDGATLERQEFVLPFPPGEDPERFLGLTGARLLLTGSP